MAVLSKFKQSFSSMFAFFGDAWSELKKVKWPNRKEMTSYTIVVLGTVTFVTLYFWVIDLGISELLRVIFD